MNKVFLILFILLLSNLNTDTSIQLEPSVNFVLFITPTGRMVWHKLYKYLEQILNSSRFNIHLF